MSAIHDTCSLITLDKLLQERRSLARFFPKKVFALEASFSLEQMYPETAERMKERVEFVELPPPAELAGLISGAGLSKSLSDADRLIFAVAIHQQMSVVTGDKPLAKAVRKQGITVGNVALILKALVQSERLAPSSVEALLQALAEKNELLLGKPKPTWSDLEGYEFPG